MRIGIWLDGRGEVEIEDVDEFHWDCYDGLVVVAQSGTFTFAAEEINCGDFEED